jgi:hypothetical protein
VIRVGNAPCSWGVLEFDLPPAPVPAAQVLDEMTAAGYAATELGDWGFLPTEPHALADAVGRRGLALAGAFVPVALARADAYADGIMRAVRTARLLGDAGFRDAFIVLSDDNATVPHRTARAGRITAGDGLDADSGTASPRERRRSPRPSAMQPGCARCSIITARGTWKRPRKSTRCCRGPIRRCSACVSTLATVCSAAATRWS